MSATVNTDVITYVEAIGCGTFGKDLYFGRVPNSVNTPTELWWIVPINSTVLKHNVSGEDTIQYQYELNFRSMSVETVSHKLFEASQKIVGSHCYNLDNFHTIEVQLASVNQMTVLDSENRINGTIVFTVKVYNILSQRSDKLEQNDSQ